MSSDAAKPNICCTTVHELWNLISKYPMDMPVKIHVGWDWNIGEIDQDEDGLILFPDIPDDMNLVETKWIHHHVHTKECCGD